MLNRIVRAATSLLRDATRDAAGRRGGRSGGRAHRTPTTDAATASGPVVDEPLRTTVEFTGELPPLVYEARPDDDPDPGEVVWAWVPYEENDGRGKDRPVLVIARHGRDVLGLQATSKDHDRDHEDEARWGRHWFDIGSGGWDSQGRDSEVRLDRVLLVPAGAVRREGAGLDRARFDAVVAALDELRRRR